MKIIEIQFDMQSEEIIAFDGDEIKKQRLVPEFLAIANTTKHLFY